ncbi:MAG: NADH-ubiquinone oxidoreductase-F iron-sulfur binding region domain-containing protein [Clostridia bacterium]|jgi:NADH-quinone oxidoreductase subunit F|nr:NADH-quinone oxidoreductase subunit NuoF [Clostridia bacterium]MDH7572812.1 NADH-ubiquinone oxidoreductase-F iron-sulfur binding region domain-containing protein [Clostridia bacterium]
MPRVSSPAELEKLRNDILARRGADRRYVCVPFGSDCRAAGSGEVAARLEEELRKQGLDREIAVKRTGCLGLCEREPMLVIYPEGICYLDVRPEDVPEIVGQTIKGGKLVERLLYVDPASNERIACINDIPFYKHQVRLLLGVTPEVDPASIEDYLAVGGYSALAKALFEMTPEQVITEVKKSGLRGRGGAGFPTGRKWEEARHAPGDLKYVIVNADEGDPGAFMDRSVLEGNPHSVLEGLIIGGYAVGAREGFFYVREEYPLALEHVRLAIKQAEEYGFLGKNILGSGFDFTVTVHQGAGAYVVGESSALMTAIEGRVGEPRPKYIHTVVKGVWGRPSVLNNVETWANVPQIVNKGGDWLAGYGTERSKGTKVFSLVGKVNNPGLVEVPMGMTLRDIIYKIGGGMRGGGRCKAVQTGGPSGGCIPEDLLDLRVDFDELTKAGSIMGSGGMIVMDDETCMVDLARYFIEFLSDESCGKCVPCREGLRQMLGILTDITKGRGKEGDIETLEELSEVMMDAALCALGRAAPTSLLSTLRYFRDEYVAHIRDKRCPALFCKDLVAYCIDPQKCSGCGKCLAVCPTGAIVGSEKQPHAVDQAKCRKCGACLEVCPPEYGAVSKLSGEPVPSAEAAATLARA